MKRVSKDGNVSYALSPTVSEDVYRMLRRIAIESEGTLTSTMRTAIVLGLDRMNKEFAKREAGEPNRCEAIERMLRMDGRKKDGGLRDEQ